MVIMVVNIYMFAGHGGSTFRAEVGKYINTF